MLAPAEFPVKHDDDQTIGSSLHSLRTLWKIGNNGGKKVGQGKVKSNTMSWNNISSHFLARERSSFPTQNLSLPWKSSFPFYTYPYFEGFPIIRSGCCDPENTSAFLDLKSSSTSFVLLFFSLLFFFVLLSLLLPLCFQSDTDSFHCSLPWKNDISYRKYEAKVSDREKERGNPDKNDGQKYTDAVEKDDSKKPGEMKARRITSNETHLFI